MAKDARPKRAGPTELLVVEAEEFPTAVIVELWHRNREGHREFLDSRRYDSTDDRVEPDAVQSGPAPG